MILKFSGHSDDVFQCEIESTGTGEESIAVSAVYVFTLVDAFGDGLHVIGLYAPQAILGACWVVGVAQLNEGIPLPSWNMRYETASSGYSPVLILEVPDNVEITSIQEGDRS